MERKIGEIFEYNGEWYQCIRSILTCSSCEIPRPCTKIKELGYCSPNMRNDKEQVVFKKLEKVGEPYEFFVINRGTILLQKYKMLVKPHIYGALYSIHYEDNTIDIEIKQNKEDMEEKKLNLKPFDLEAAKAGKPVCTRDERKARIICFNAEGNKPLIVLSKIDGKEVILRYTEKGQSDNYHSPTPREDDLMMLPEKHEGYANIVKEALSDDKVVLGRIFDSYEDAFRSGEANERYIATVKIQWEE